LKNDRATTRAKLIGPDGVARLNGVEGVFAKALAALR